MPEGDTVWRTATRLHAALADRPVVLADLRWPGLPHHPLVGTSTVAVVSAGKHLLHRFSNGWTLHSHLRMDGQWRIDHAGSDTARTLRRRDVRAAIGVAPWTAVGLRLGRLDLVPTSDEHRLVGHLGPDILGPNWDAEEAARRVTAFDGFVVDALLDQRVLAGVGTYWASEALFLERLLPWTPTADLTTNRVDALVARLHQLLSQATRDAAPASVGGNQHQQSPWVHARSGRPCRRCGHQVRIALTGTPPRQRTIFSCPTCQGGWAPTDDRAPQAPLGSGQRRDQRRR